MKTKLLKLSAILLILAGVVSSCEKEKDIDMSKIDFSNIENLYAQPLSVIQKAVQGKWKLYQTCGGVVGCTYHENFYIIITSNEIITDTNEGVHSVTLYSWKKKKVDVSGELVNSYVLWPDGADETAQVGRYFISLRNDTLTFGSCQLTTEESIFAFVGLRVK
jgi:hypothetical protein